MLEKGITSPLTVFTFPIHMCIENEEEIVKWMYTDEVIRSPNLIGSTPLLTSRDCDGIEQNEIVLNMTQEECVELYGVHTPACEDEDLVGMACDDKEFIHH
ncbi:unnamed protein product [Cylicostephanus goldi]|uniref:Uncharacterized protein n=1 Tax=Cylicostephanus goldi TaxID=71465 RepID=A0A3P7LTI7_CYLGO|nr:unnamed protein product [Cylicostephanus goldi]